MAYLGKARKSYLLEICEEIGVEVDSSSKVVEIKKLILSSEFYQEDEVKIILDRLIENRKQQEQMSGETRQFELDMKKLELSKDDSDQRREAEKRGEFGSRIQLTQITPKFDEKQYEMGLYLINFKRRGEMAQVPRMDWVAYLLAVLPPELSNILARESPSDACNYDFVKTLILRRYKLNSEKLKQSFHDIIKQPINLGEIMPKNSLVISLNVSQS
ncbi:SCAN box domain-containing protein [Trichonephila clavata]|uniref:SCAN box domain-containing protein n=1 Tax=Trichonephila clavata TaxID=2740835 RepID=A0A8X6M0I6_TRICU|nr:SCAN box domain-containing protein [Trichonephila clavata]